MALLRKPRVRQRPNGQWSCLIYRTHRLGAEMFTVEFSTWREALAFALDSTVSSGNREVQP